MSGEKGEGQGGQQGGGRGVRWGEEGAERGAQAKVGGGQETEAGGRWGGREGEGEGTKGKGGVLTLRLCPRVARAAVMVVDQSRPMTSALEPRISSSLPVPGRAGPREGG